MSTATIQESIQGKIAMMDFDLRALVLWEEAEAQGINSSGGGCFGLDTRLFNGVQKREWRWHSDRFVKKDVNGGSRPEMYNYFRYPNGSTIKLDPMLKAVHV